MMHTHVLAKAVDFQKTEELLLPIQVRSFDKNNLPASDPNYYQIFWIESGVDKVSIDFDTIACLPYSIIFLMPGTIVKFGFKCEQPMGWIIEFSRKFFMEQHLNGFNIKNVDLLYASGEIPIIALSPKIGMRIHSIAEMISEMMQSQIPNKEIAASSLLKTLLVYCDSKCNIRIKNNSNNHYLQIVSSFKHLVSQNYYTVHRVSEYAKMLNVTAKYLNQVLKDVMGVNAKSVIQEQLIIQACRDLKFTNESIKEIAINLGFSEPEHFTNFFKKNTGCSPLAFRMK